MLIKINPIKILSELRIVVDLYLRLGNRLSWSEFINLTFANLEERFLGNSPGFSFLLFCWDLVISSTADQGGRARWILCQCEASDEAD